MNRFNKISSFFLGLSFILFPKIVSAQVMLPSFADLVEQLSPSVVNISTVQKESLDDLDSNPLLNGADPFGTINVESPAHAALGSGFIIDDNGYILTNSHVIENASDISVIMSDNDVLPAKVIGFDKKTDLALIKIETTKKLQPVKFGDSDQIRVGDWILAIGNPFGLGGSVTAGIVSAKSRDIESGPYDNFIQTDASINQGSSGGPMFNLNGEVIGVNTAIFSTTGGSMGVGFAIPINLTHFVINQLKDNGEVRRGWIGVRIQQNSVDLSQSLGANRKQGVVVSSVNEQASAAKSGIEAGDIILSFDGIDIDNTKNFSRMVAETEIGKTVAVKIWRNQNEITLNVLIEEMPPEIIQPKLHSYNVPDQDIDYNQSAEVTGITFSNIDGDILDKFQLPSSSRGIIITNVNAQSDAASKGLKAGDIIRQIDRKEVYSIDDARGYIADAILEDYRPILFTIQNGEDIHFVAVKLKRT